MRSRGTNLSQSRKLTAERRFSPLSYIGSSPYYNKMVISAQQPLRPRGRAVTAAETFKYTAAHKLPFIFEVRRKSRGLNIHFADAPGRKGRVAFLLLLDNFVPIWAQERTT